MTSAVGVVMLPAAGPWEVLGKYNILRRIPLAPLEILYKTLYEQPITPVSQSATPNIAIGGDMDKYMQVLEESITFPQRNLISTITDICQIQSLNVT